MPILRFVLCAIVLAAAGDWPGRAAADTNVCIAIGTLPTTISVPGHYCLDGDFHQSFATAAIHIAADDVVLDCNGHRIAQGTQSGVSGIFANNRSRVTVRSCNVEFFGRGIYLYESTAGASRGNHVADNLVRRSLITGIQVHGSNHVIERNRVNENLGGIAGSLTYGIYVSSNYGSAVGRGTGNVVRDNVVTAFVPTVYFDVVGIYLEGVTNTEVSGNAVSALFAPLGRNAYGILGGPDVSATLAVGNQVLAATTATPPGGTINFGGTNRDGILFNDPPTASLHNVCQDNVVGNFLTNIQAETTLQGCIKAGNTEL